MTAAFEVPFALDLLALPPDVRGEDLLLRDGAAVGLRDEAADERRLDALALFAWLREPDDLLFEEPLRPLFWEALRLLLPEALWLLGLDPFELREFVFCLPPERVLAWAIATP